MKAHYTILSNTTGVNIYTDELIQDERNLITLMERIDGVEKVEMGRYHFFVDFAMMFDTMDMVERVVSAAKEYFGMEELTPFPPKVIFDRITAVDEAARQGLSEMKRDKDIFGGGFDGFGDGFSA